MKKRILIIGGDQRTPFLAKYFQKNQYEVFLYGIDKYPSIPIEVTLTHFLSPADIIVLPIPITKDNVNINAPFSSVAIPIMNVLEICNKNTFLFGGKIPDSIMEIAKEKQMLIYDYGASEDFAIENALPTAEGTIEILLSQTPYTLEGKSICIVGYGRIGKVLAKKLIALGCDVTVTARREEQLKEIQDIGGTPLLTSCLFESKPFQIIINTVPSLVINQQVLSVQRKDCFVVDLASNPGGVDFEYAKSIGMKTLHALSLPAKYSPKTAAHIIGNTISKILNEKE